MGKAWYFADNNSVTDHMHVYDPKSGWSERKDWKLAEPLVGGKYDGVEAGQWTIDRKQFIVMDDRMRIYRFDDAAESFGLVGRADYGGSETWVWNVAASGKKAYFMPSDPAEGLFEYDLEKKSTIKLCGIGELDDKAGAVTRHTGYDGWDADGKFYFTSFKRDGTENVMISSVDPVRLKVAKNLLPGIMEVTVDAAINGFTFSRKGPTTSALEVVYRIIENNTASPAYAPQIGRIAMPAGSASVKLPQASLNLKDPAAKSITVSVIPDGDTYLAGTARNATLGESGLMVRHVGYNGLKPWLSVSGAAGALSLNLDLPSTWMGGPLTLRLLSVSGQVLRSYSLNGNARQVLSWNGRNASGIATAPGLVLAELKGKTFSAHARLSDSP